METRIEIGIYEYPSKVVDEAFQLVHHVSFISIYYFTDFSWFPLPLRSVQSNHSVQKRKEWNAHS